MTLKLYKGIGIKISFMEHGKPFFPFDATRGFLTYLAYTYPSQPDRWKHSFWRTM